MPIYAYKCESCGHAKDVLQKMSDDPLTQCPSCGNGWYATDFKGGAASTSAPAVAGTAAGAASTSSDAGGASPSAEPSASAAPAACGASCACH
jgi:putative FmdB family regulatory protein